MAKEKISVTVDATVLAAADARSAGLNRSEMIEQALRNLHNYTTRTVPALGIDAYAEQVYRVNRTAGL
jgi:metal-responsive CopG/Arc/MetJ family transcriptional regulator